MRCRLVYGSYLASEWCYRCFKLKSYVVKSDPYKAEKSIAQKLPNSPVVDIISG